MTAVTVLMPVHQHAEPLRYAVASVLNQTLPDFELFLVGDGVTDATRSVVEELVACHNRIRFFDFPKGPRKGEVHWHEALQQAQGRFAAYLGSDDCWMPHHLEVLDELLEDADFAHTLHVMIDKDRIVARPADMENTAFRERMVNRLFNRVDFSFGGHTVAAYHRLPQGWNSIPPDFPAADFYMWRQFLAQAWCRVRSGWIPTGIHTATHLRPNLSDRERAEDLAYWYGRIADPVFREELWQEIAQCFGRQSVAFESRLWDFRVKSSVKASALKSKRAELARAKTRITRLERKRVALGAALTAMINSTSWKVTWPLRQIRLTAARMVGRKSEPFRENSQRGSGASAEQS
jgi:Glycosyl transferase family 2